MEITSTLINELQTLESRLWLKEFRFDMEWMENILDDNFFEFGRSGRTYTRKECLDTHEQEIHAVLPLTNFKIHAIDTNVVQATYISIVTYGADKQYGLRSSIWVYQNNCWKLKFHQGTPLVK